jgi:hypothetical protein
MGPFCPSNWWTQGTWRYFTSNLVGGSNPSEKNESQLGLLFPIDGKKTCSKPPTSVVLRWFNNVSHSQKYRNTPTITPHWQSPVLSCKVHHGYNSPSLIFLVPSHVLQVVVEAITKCQAFKARGQWNVLQTLIEKASEGQIRQMFRQTDLKSGGLVGRSSTT